jgi:hypothetical protein
VYRPHPYVDRTPSWRTSCRTCRRLLAASRRFAAGSCKGPNINPEVSFFSSNHSTPFQNDTAPSLLSLGLGNPSPNLVFYSNYSSWPYFPCIVSIFLFQLTTVPLSLFTFPPFSQKITPCCITAQKNSHLIVKINPFIAFPIGFIPTEVIIYTISYDYERSRFYYFLQSYFLGPIFIHCSSTGLKVLRNRRHFKNNNVSNGTGNPSQHVGRILVNFCRWKFKIHEVA